jgi:hypothetical protein
MLKEVSPMVELQAPPTCDSHPYSRQVVVKRFLLVTILGNKVLSILRLKPLTSKDRKPTPSNFSAECLLILPLRQIMTIHLAFTPSLW